MKKMGAKPGQRTFFPEGDGRESMPKPRLQTKYIVKI